MSARPQVVADVEKTGDTVEARFVLKSLPLEKLPSLYLTEAKKPLFVVVGAADLALEQAKQVPAQVRTIPAQVRTIPAQVKTLREDVEDRVEMVTDKATDFYGQLSVRGERLITSIRRQPATEAAVAEGKQAVRKAEASATAAKKSAKAGGKAVQDAAASLG